MDADARADLYRELHRKHGRDEATRRYGAGRVLGPLVAALRPASILDVGCGTGLWLAVAGELGIADIRGIEGPWIEGRETHVPTGAILRRDLEKPFDLGRRFDLVMSIEVGEHLSEGAAEGFVASLVRHGDVVLFSAAIPGQPGTGHVNCRFPDWWAALFATHGLRPVDIVRPAIWTDRGIHVWIRQNVLLFATDAARARLGWPVAPGPISIVHPEMYAALTGARPGRA